MKQPSTPLPVPLSMDRSIPRSRATRRANGEMKRRSPEARGAAGLAGAAAGAGVGAGAAAAGAGGGGGGAAAAGAGSAALGAGAGA